MECIEPVKYSICLDLSNKSLDKFPGFLELTFKITKITDRLLLNANNISIIDLALSDKNNKSLEAKFNLKNKVLTIATKSLNKGNYTLRVNYLANYSKNLSGVYKTQDQSNGDVFISTHFEPNFAASCFPCFDEPNFRSVFALSFVLNQEDSVVSNTSLIETQDINASLKKHIFADTIPLPAYLVAFAVGNLHIIETAQSGRTTINVWARSKLSGMGKFALNTAVKSFNYLSKYFAIPYGNEVLNLVALPELPFNGMENDGALFFREKCLLIDNSNTLTQDARLVCDTICHEISHLWFGNMVGIESWSMLWLKEAVATLIQIKLVNILMPEFKRWNLFAYARQNAMFIDGLNSTRPIEVNKNNTDKAYEMFDTITYQKGSQILAWFENYCNPSAFGTVIRSFLQKYKYQSTTGLNLFKEMEKLIDFPVFKLIPYWLNDSGYPLISVDMIDENTFKISQTPFKYIESDNQKIFNLPLTLKIYPKENQDKPYLFKFIFESQSNTFVTDFKIQTVMANAYGLGFYRTDYKYKFSLNELKNFTISENLSILGDYYAYLLSLKYSWTDFFDLIDNFKYFQDEAIWLYLKEIYSELKLCLNEAMLENLNTLFLKMIQSNLDLYKIDIKAVLYNVSNNINDAYLIPLMEILGLCDEKFLAPLADVKIDGINDLFKPVIVNTLSCRGNIELFNYYYDAYINGLSPQDRQIYFAALACFSDSNIHDTLFGYIKSGKIMQVDLAYLLKNMLLNRYSSDSTWNFIVDNFDYLNSIISDTAFSNIYMGLSGLVGSMNDSKLNALETFLDNYYKFNIPTQARQQLEKLMILYKLRVNLMTNSLVHGIKGS